MPRNVQKDPESSLAWTIKDEVVRRGRSYYGKLRGSRCIFVARRLVPHFNALFGIPRKQEPSVLSQPAQDILKVLRKEWEMSTRDLRSASGVKDRVRFTKAIDELQRVFKVIPGEVVYEPKFTYIWTLAESRFQDELATALSREEALKEIARAYLAGRWDDVAGRTCARHRPIKPGRGNWELGACR